MTNYKCFETKEEANKFKKEHGGVLIDFNKKVQGMKNVTFRQFYSAYTSADTTKYNYSVEWNGSAL